MCTEGMHSVQVSAEERREKKKVLFNRHACLDTNNDRVHNHEIPHVQSERYKAFNGVLIRSCFLFGRGKERFCVCWGEGSGATAGRSLFFTGKQSFGLSCIMTMQ